jgi:hypothetical protein
MHGVEAASVFILALYLAVQQRRGRLASFAKEAAAIAVAGYLAEDLCIRAFGFYAYNPGWSLTLDRMPFLVALIWPFVILSARDVAMALAPNRSPVVLATTLVMFDASLIEPVAVRAGLWTWSESALWGVPLVGIWGWGVFAAVVLTLLERQRVVWVPLLAPPLSNALLVVSWWAAFRWGPRDELPYAEKLLLSATAAAVLLAYARRRRGVAGLFVMGPRAVAAALFFALVALYGDGMLWAYVIPFGAPYLWLTAWRRAPHERPAAAS